MLCVFVLIYGNLVFFACQIIEFLLDLREIKQKFASLFEGDCNKNTHTSLSILLNHASNIHIFFSTTIQIISVILKKTESNC